MALAIEDLSKFAAEWKSYNIGYDLALALLIKSA
jgi:hypothetical protein